MTIPSERLKDFIDGNLAPQEASDLAAKISDDPDLAAFVEDQKALKGALASPAAIWLRGLHERTKSANWIPAATMAAGIALGILLAASFGIGTDLRSEDGTLIAQGALAHVLSTSLSREEVRAPSEARIAASFWSKNGFFCRSFVTRGNTESRLAGVACRERGAWRIQAMSAMAPDNLFRSPVTPASLPAPVRNVMENLIVGVPLDPDSERQARSQSWRAR